MIPVLGVPYINRSDLFVRMITSISHPIETIVVIDNAADDTVPRVDGAIYIKPHRNMGVSWAWNTIIKATPHAPWWAISNADIKLGEHDLANLEAGMASGLDLCLVESMALFGISAECVQKVGWFDENYAPAYCEDNDYLYRAKLIGVRIDWLIPEFEHFGSASIKSDPKLYAGNALSYPENVKYYARKWGGVMHQEVYTTPFDQGGSPRDCPTLDFDRLRRLSWDRPA